MKILHVHNIRWWNATSHYAYNLALALDELGHEQMFITGKGNPINEKLEMNNWDTLPILPDKDIEYFPLFFKKFPIKTFDLIITYWGRDQHLFYLKKSRKQKLFRVWVDAQDMKANSFSKKLFKNTDLIVLPSQTEIDKFQKRGIDFNNFFILRGTIEKKVECSNYSNKNIRILHIARSDKVKGHIYFLKALKILKEKDIVFSAIFIGNEANIKWEHLIDLSEKLGISANCEFLRYQTDIFPYLKRADLGIISSIGSEAYSRALFEYFSASLPVVATNIGIIPEIYNDVEFGSLVKNKSPEELARGILDIKANWQKYHENVGSYYEKNLSFNIFKQNVSKMLEK